MSSHIQFQGRSQPFCIEGFLIYIVCSIDNRTPEALFTRGVRGHAPPENVWNLGLQKWRFLDSEHKFPIILAPNVASISKRGLQISLPEEMDLNRIKNG